MLEVFTNWIQDHRTAIAWIAFSSVIVGIGSVLAIPWIIIRLPADYFVGSVKPMTSWRVEHPGFRMMMLGLKNVLGVVFIFVGIALLVFPGQGLLTIFIGLMMLNFPGKRRVERWIVSRPQVFRGLNWIREKAGQAPLIYDEPKRLTRE